MLIYKVIDRYTGRDAKESFPHCPYIVTPDGEVAWWDEGQGWAVDEFQGRYKIVVSVYSSGDDSCKHMNTKSIRKDKFGNLFQCNSCGMRTARPGELPWRQPGIAFYPDDPFNLRGL